MLTRLAFGLVAIAALASSARGDVGDPQVRTEHPWYPGELACSNFERLFADQRAQYSRVAGPVATDEQRALASWYWRNTHFYHAMDARQDIFGVGYDKEENWTREYWTGLFAFGHALCGTTHSQWAGEMEMLLGHARSRTVGVDGHTSFEVFLTGGPYGAGKWVLLDHDISTVIFDPTGSRLLSIPEIKADIKRLTDRRFQPERQRGWLVSALHPEDAPGVYTLYTSAAYLPGYAGPPPMLTLRRGETLRRYLEPGLEDGKTFVYWGRDYKRGLPGPERNLTWVNQPELMHGSRTGTPGTEGQARYGNAVYTYRPDFGSDSYREGVVDEDAQHVTFAFATPYIIAATPLSTSDWGVQDPGCKNGLVLHGNARCQVSLSFDGGHSWRDCGLFRDGLDLTDLAKSRRHYQIRFGAGAKALAGAGLTMTTICQANPTILPHLTDGNATVQFAASGKEVVSTGPILDDSRAHVVNGGFGTPDVTLELATPRGAPALVVYAAAQLASGNPPREGLAQQIDYSTDGGKTWKALVKDWKLPRQGEEPPEFWSSTFCFGSVDLKDNASARVLVRFHNDQGVSCQRAEMHLTYATPNVDATLVTFAWTDQSGAHRESHVFSPAKSSNWQVPTGRKVRTRWVEFEPVAVK